MRLPTRYSQRSSLRINITPLIDVVFLLIIFFLVASHFVRSEQAAPVELPLATGGDADHDQAAHRLTVTIGKEGQYFINVEPVEEVAVLGRIEELQTTAASQETKPEVRLRGHRDAAFGAMRKLIEHCAGQNIRSIRFAVDIQGGNQP